jgi:hypothetical protein
MTEVLNLDEVLLEKARRLSGLQEKTALLHAGLQAPHPLMLVDTSVWVDHFRHRDPLLVDLLESGDVECHPFIIGELACGNPGAPP